MAHRTVETLLGRLATDPDLLHRFADDPDSVVAELDRQGLRLTPVELDALLATDPEAIAAFAATLDRRIRKAESSGGSPRVEPEVRRHE